MESFLIYMPGRNGRCTPEVGGKAVTGLALAGLLACGFFAGGLLATGRRSFSQRDTVYG